MGMTFARLELTDGATSIDLLHGGVYAKDYKPGVPQLKNNGIWQDSALATERRLIDRRFGNVIDTVDMAISGPNQDDTIARCGDLFRLLEKARDFTASSWQSVPVWLKRQAGCETNPTYALIFDYKIEQLANPFAAPFAAATELATLDGFDLGLEHGIWLSEPPGAGACVQAGTSTGWEINAAWVDTGATPNNDVHALLQSRTTGRIFSGEDGRIEQSDDDGDTWALCTAAPVGEVLCMIQTATGRILAGETGGIWRSDNDGGAWAFSVEAFTKVYSLLQLASGRILAGDDGQIWASDDNGTTWALVTTDPTDFVRAMIQITTGPTTGRVIALASKPIWGSDDDGATWYALSYAENSLNDQYSILQTTSGRILRDDYNVGGYVASSLDGGESWADISDAPVSFVYSMIQMAGGRILFGELGNIWKSDDDGITLGLMTSAPTNEVFSMLQTSTGRILAGENDHIWKSGPTVATTMGAAASCADEQFVANKQNTANLTHIYVAAGGGLVFGVNLLPHVFPVRLLPPIPAVNDAVYFGNNAGDPFESLVFDLDNIITYTGSYTIVWEYYNGTAWATLTVVDGTNPGSAGRFLQPGVSSVHWQPPAAWAAVAVNGVTGLWVRARVSALAGTMTPPTQQNRNIYTITWPDVDVPAAQVSGDIPALAQILITNRSNSSGRGATTPLWDNRIFVGLRSYSRGAGFAAYLNAADEQNPDGISVTLGAGTAYSNAVSAITGRLVTYSAGAGDTTFTSRVTFSLATAAASMYYGTFHAFVRAGVTAGASGDIHARLQVTTGTGGVTLTSQDDWLKTTTDFEVLDLGRVTIPASGLLNTTDVGDVTTLAIQFRNDSSAARTVYVHDLILIPVDECAIDAVDYANVTDSIVGRAQDVKPRKLLDFDSLTYQKVDLRTLVRLADPSRYVTAIYVPGGGPAMLQANARQRLWVFAMRTSDTVSGYSWIAEPWIAHSVQVLANERWLGFRGDR